MPKRNIRDVGGRGSGRPQDWFMYGKRKCQLVETYPRKRDAERKAAQLEADGILAVVRKWYSKWCVYRCGARHRARSR